MSNMSYCRFQNTVRDVAECFGYINAKLSPEEDEARQWLVKIARNIVAEFDDEPNDERNDEEEDD